jgi:hypothetical protein
MPRPILGPLALLISLVITDVAGAQEPARTVAVSVSYGVFQFDLSGTGDARMIALRVERVSPRWLVLEGGVVVARPGQQFGDTTTLVIPEAQTQFQLVLGRVAPYLGVGMGMAFDLRDEVDGGTQRRLTLSGATGLRAWFTERFGARAELRIRGFGSNFGGSSAEWTGGLALRF